MKRIYLPLLLAAFGSGVMNADVKIGETVYSTLNAAVDAAADGDEIVITGVTEIDSRVNISKGITIKGGDAEAQIKRKWGKNFTIMLNFMAGSETAVVKDLTVSGSTVKVNGTTVEINYDCRSNSSFATLQNVTFIECTNTNTNNQGIICVKGNGRMVLDGVKIIEPNTPNFTMMGDVFCGNNDDVILKGDNRITLNLEGRVSVDGSLTNAEPIGINIIKGINVGGLAVKGCHDVSKFTLLTAAENTRLTDGRDGLMYSSFIPAVENIGTGEKYTSLAEAVAALAEGDNEFSLLEDVTIDARLIPGAGKSVSFTGKDGVKTITRGNFNAGQSTFEMNNSSNGTLRFKDVHFVNANASVSNAMLVAQGGSVVLENVTEAFETNSSWNLQVKTNGHATATDTQLRKVLVNDRGHLYIDGNNDMTITLQSGASDLQVSAGGELTNEKKIRIVYQTLPEVGTVVVGNCEDAAKFFVNHAGYSLVAESGNLVLAAAPEVPVLTVNGSEVIPTQLRADDIVTVTAPEGYTVWWKEVDYVATEPALLSASELAGYTDSGAQNMTYTVAAGKKVSFICANADQSQVSVPYTFAIASDGTVTGIEEVECGKADAPVEWYTMQGVRVAEPAGGLFIMKQGNKVTKVVVK